LLFRAFFYLAGYMPGTRAVHAGYTAGRAGAEKKVGAIFGRRSKKWAKNPIYVGVREEGKALGRRAALTPLPAGGAVPPEGTAPGAGKEAGSAWAASGCGAKGSPGRRTALTPGAGREGRSPRAGRPCPTTRFCCSGPFLTWPGTCRVHVPVGRARQKSRDQFRPPGEKKAKKPDFCRWKEKKAGSPGWRTAADTDAGRESRPPAAGRLRPVVRADSGGRRHRVKTGLSHGIRGRQGLSRPAYCADTRCRPGEPSPLCGCPV